MPERYFASTYISDLRAIRAAGSATAETSFYPPLEKLLTAAGQTLKPNVLCTLQLRNQGAGMPDRNGVAGRGLAPERPWSTTEQAPLRTLASELGLALELAPEQAPALLGEQMFDIHLNGAAHWSGVPKNVWEYTLGGYQVLKKWLSYREAPLLGRPLLPEEADYFAQVVRRIAAILLLSPALDAAYAQTCRETR